MEDSIIDWRVYLIDFDVEYPKLKKYTEGSKSTSLKKVLYS